jgi:hypothetical protein
LKLKDEGQGPLKNAMMGWGCRLLVQPAGGPGFGPQNKQEKFSSVERGEVQWWIYPPEE